jgi:hypothetical protein
MGNILRAGLAVLVFAIVFAATAWAQDKPKANSKNEKENSKAATQARKELEATFVERSKFVKDMNAEAQIGQVSPDYTASLPDGRSLVYNDIVTYMRGLVGQFVSVTKADITIESFELKGNEAIVDARQHIIRRQRLADGNIHDVETGVLQREIWVKTDKGWKSKRVDNLREQKVLVDGNPVSPRDR